MTVRHATTGAPGEVTHETVLDRDFAGDMAGPWSFVRFEDGLACWCPNTNLVFPTTAQAAGRVGTKK